MTELEMKTEVEAGDFDGALSDEALDRSEGAYCSKTGGTMSAPPVDVSVRSARSGW